MASRQNTRLRRLLAGLGITLAVALLAGALAVRSGTEAAAQRETATAQRLAATAISEDYLAQRMLTAVAGVRTEESPQTVGALLSVLAANPAIVDRIDTPNRLLGAAAAPGSDQAVAIANLEAVHVFDTVTGESRVAWSEPDANLVELRVSPDGSYAAFASTSWSGRRPPQLVVLDLATGQIVWTRPIETEPIVLFAGWDFTDTPGELAVATTEGIELVRVDGSAPTSDHPPGGHGPAVGADSPGWPGPDGPVRRRNRAGPVGGPAHRARRGAARGRSDRVGEPGRPLVGDPGSERPPQPKPARSSSSTSTPRTPTRCRSRSRETWAVRRSCPTGAPSCSARWAARWWSPTPARGRCARPSPGGTPARSWASSPAPTAPPRGPRDATAT